MAAAATDRWSPASLSWSFGDGATAAGGAVTHAFGRTGAFDATVTATDAAGNASSATHSILVTPAAPRVKKVIRAKVRVTWGVREKRIFLLRLKVTSVPKGGKVELRCNKAKRQEVPVQAQDQQEAAQRRDHAFKEIKASNVAGKKRRSFRAGQRLELRITAKDFVGKVVRYELKKGKIPSGRELCLKPGGKKPRKRC